MGDELQPTSDIASVQYWRGTHADPPTTTPGVPATSWKFSSSLSALIRFQADSPCCSRTGASVTLSLMRRTQSCEASVPSGNTNKPV